MARQTFYFRDGPYLQAMQGLRAALVGSEAFVKFIGQPRTGKSSVCEKLTQFMRRKDYRVIYFDYPIESPDMLRSMLAKELDIPDTFNILRHLEDALAAETEKPLVVIFDDAHLLSDITLIEIYRLVSVQLAQKRVINIVLCGEPELERRLRSKQEFTSLLQHVSHNFLLEPMNPATTSRFLLAYLEKVELADLQLEPAAHTQFYKSCKGFPGPAYSLCRLLLSMRQNKQELRPITKDEMLLAIRNADSEQPVSSGLLREGNRWMLFGPLAAVVVIASLALLMRQLNPPEVQNEVEAAVSLAVEVAQQQAASSVASSPFAVDELLAANPESSTETNSAVQLERVSAQGASSSPKLKVGEPNDERAAVAQELPVSDSDLALVTAQERGISNEFTTESLVEQMASNVDAVPLESVILSRPMLALDDEEIEAQIATATPNIAPQLGSQETSVESVAEILQREPSSIESLPSEPSASGSTTLSPQQMVQDWVDAWEGRELQRYFASYDESFVPRYHRSKLAWRNNRERVIGNASQISLELSDFVIISEDAESIEVHFWLAYSSPSYRDDTRKKLVLRKLPASDKGGARLLILEEINLEVRA